MFDARSVWDPEVGLAGARVRVFPAKARRRKEVRRKREKAKREEE